MMTETADWQRVADEVRRRLEEMEVDGNLAALARASGVSDSTWRNLLAGKPVTRPDKRRQICKYLGWPADAFDVILAGGTVTVTAPGPPLDEPAASLAELVAIRSLLAELLDEWRSDRQGPPRRGGRR